MADKTDLERAVDEMISDLDKSNLPFCPARDGGMFHVSVFKPESPDDTWCYHCHTDMGLSVKTEPLNEEDTQYWRSEYWALKDEYDQLVDQIETLVRKYCNG